MHKILHFCSTLLFLHLRLEWTIYIDTYCSISHYLWPFNNLMRSIAVSWINLDYLLLWNIIFKKSITTNICTFLILFIFRLSFPQRWFYYTWMTISDRLIFMRVNLAYSLKNLWKMMMLWTLNHFSLKIWLSFIFLL